MKNIAYVHSVAAIGGAERVSQSIIERLSDQYRAVLFCPEEGPMVTECSSIGASTEIFSFTQPSLTAPIKTLTGFLKWRSVLKHHEIEVIHTADLICTRTLLTAANSLNIPVICHIHFPFEEQFVNWVFSKNRQAAGFIFCSEELSINVGSFLSNCCNAASQTVIHNGVDTARFQPLAKTDESIRIGIIANLQERKGHEDFLAMAHIVLQEFPDVQFDIVGGDILQQPREPHLRSMATNLGIEASVMFHGQVSDVLSLLQQMDIVVCASHEEAFPISILEAMACGKAIVSTNVNGIPEAITDMENGMLVSPAKPKQLASRVLRILKDPSFKLMLEDRARARVVDNFSDTFFVKEIQRVYRLHTR